MKICIVSDTHTYHSPVKIPDCDILIHCGDSTLYGEIWEMNNFLTWFGNQPAKHKIFINGNHEVQVWKLNLTKQLVESHNKYFMTNIHYLEDERLGLAGFNFYGSPRTPEFFDWAYMFDRDDGGLVWNGIPDSTDILITHGPPAGILDTVQPFGEYNRSKAGCDALLEKVRQVQPKLHCFGHIHTSYGWEQHGETLFVNAATCDARYVPNHPPIVVDTDTWQVI
jgi:predicted phosphodiesterase